MERQGYRIVAYSPDIGFRTLAQGMPLELEIGTVLTMAGAGIFLGTSRRFCEDYYAGLTDDEDVLLTYAYDESDLSSGLPDDPCGEITVRRARLIAVENLTRPKADMDEELRQPARGGLKR